MLCKTLSRFASRTSTAIPTSSLTVTRGGAQVGDYNGVPKVFCRFGHWKDIHFMNHPGVMAISKLLHMDHITQMRANFTAEDVANIKEYDEELARKATIALEEQVPINFVQLEHIETILPRLKKEKQLLQEARSVVLSSAPGKIAKLPKADYNVCQPRPKNASEIEANSSSLNKDNWI